VDVDIVPLHSDEDGQLGLIRLDQVARIDKSPADPAADGGEHTRVIQVETGNRAVGPGGLNSRLGPLGADLVEPLLGDDLLGAEGGHPFVVGIRQFETGLCLREGGFGPVQFGAVRPRVDLEEDIPLPDVGPLLKGRLEQVAGDAGPHVNAGRRLHPPGEDLVVGDIPDDWPYDRDLRDLGRRPLSGRGRSASQHHAGTG
jgi:hypothetical protein